MTDTANPLPAMLDALREHNWICQHPGKYVHPVVDGKPHKALVITGDLWHCKDAAIYLTTAGTVMLMGDLWTAWKADLEFGEFLRWLTLPEPVWNSAVKVAEKKVLPGQRDLFGDED